MIRILEYLSVRGDRELGPFRLEETQGGSQNLPKHRPGQAALGIPA